MPTLLRQSTARVLIAGLALASVAGCAGVHRPDPEIVAVLDAQTDCWNNGDLDGFMRGYWKSEQLEFISTSPQVDPATGENRPTTRTNHGWQATLEGYRRRYPTRERMGILKFSELATARTGDDTMEVAGQFHLERGDDDASGRFYLDMRRIEGAWVITRDRTTSD